MEGMPFCVPGSFKIVKYQWYHKMDGVPFDRPWHMSLSSQLIWNCARAYNHNDNVAIAQDSPQAHGRTVHGENVAKRGLEDGGDSLHSKILWRCFVFTKNAGYGGARNERDAPLRS